MAKLYAITSDLLALNALLEGLVDDEGEPREPTEEEFEQLKKWFDITKDQFEGKVDNYCKLIKNWQLMSEDASAEKDNFKKEVSRLQKRSAAMENKSKALKNLLGWSMGRLEIKKFATSLFSVQFQATRGTVKYQSIFDVSKLPEEYLKPREASSSAIEKAIKDGDLIQKEGAENYGKVFKKDGTELEGVYFTKGEALYIR